MKIGVLGYDSAMEGYAGPGTTWANEMNFVMNHAPGARLFDLLTSNPACYHCTADTPSLLTYQRRIVGAVD